MRPSIVYSDLESVIGKAITQRDMRADGPAASARSAFAAERSGNEDALCSLS
jgi:hypothetical protein